MLQDKHVKWGIIGLGGIAHKFASDLKTIPNASLYAVASRQQEKANTFASKYNVKKAYGSYDSIVKDNVVDAIYIATPHAFHKQNTLLALNNGIPVLCEKPFAMNSEEVATMIATSKSKNVLLMEALWTAFIPSFTYVENCIKQNTYGKLLKLEADFGFYKAFENSSRVFNKTLGGGSLLDIGIYPVFAALSFLGIPNKIDAQASFYNNNVDASCEMIFHYKNSITAHLKSTFLEDTPTEAILHFEKATVKIHSQFHTPTCISITSNSEVKTIDFTEPTHGYQHEIKHFNSLIRQGKTESDIMSFQRSITLLSTLDNIRKSINLNY